MNVNSKKLAIAAFAALSWALTGCAAKVTASGDQTHIASEDFYAPLTQLEIPTWFFSNDIQWSFTSSLTELDARPPTMFRSLTIYKVDSSKNTTRASTFLYMDIPVAGRATEASGPFTLSPGTSDSTSTCTVENTHVAGLLTDSPEGFPAGTTKQLQCRILLRVKGLKVNSDSTEAIANLILGNSMSDHEYGFKVVLEHPAGSDQDSAFVKTKGTVAGLHDNLILGKVKVEKIVLTGAGN